MTDPAATASATQSGIEKRRHRRSAVIWPAVVTTPDGERKCTVLNLSVGGARIKIDDLARADVSVQLRIVGVGRFPSRVAWQRNDSVGLEFSLAPEVAAFAIKHALQNGRILD
ncbi:MAG: PilZ domain-containing protein [Alphaproteobacteria bacterium]|nr:PilZ domain-containing protein [Alphaproteobacteria bacterium]